MNDTNIISRLYETGAITEDDFHRLLVEAAEKYAQSGDMYRAKFLLWCCRRKYFFGRQLKQFTEDPDFRAIAISLTGILARATAAGEDSNWHPGVRRTM